ncbi:hypothetical protein SLEP1_g29885 [Rubroshorea leprosula]|uniref:BI1-like protein n=1 Tax=Rubroshorea leprosula TaxID=152421 RepID=A0AAV5K477_9ROSI|nr:hypothetical protein SLEP1_g29885 [Rubroshorea leprosula]
MGKSDIESGESLHPVREEVVDLVWVFIRKVYCIISIQWLLTAAVAFSVAHFREIPKFVLHTRPGVAIYILSVVLMFVFMILPFVFDIAHPWNFLLLGLFTISFSFGVGLSCSFVKGKIIFEAIILMSVAAISLTLYTFWAVMRGHDFSFPGPFLLSSLNILVVYALIQVFLPLGKPTLVLYGVFAAIIFCGYILYDTNKLIKHCSKDDYIYASIRLYLDFVDDLFLSLIKLLLKSAAADDSCCSDAAGECCSCLVDACFSCSD